MLKTLMLLTLLAFRPFVSAFDRKNIEMLTKAASYTFDQICELPNPDPFFDEKDLADLVNPFSNDLYSFLSSYDKSQTAQHGGGRQPDLLSNLTGWPHLHRPLTGVPVLVQKSQNILTNKEKDGEPDCSALQVVESQLKTFSEVFQNMTYAIGEICYRQCEYGGVAWNAAKKLQAMMEQMYFGSLAAQVRQLEARTGCFFISDLFLVENERAIDYTIVWIETFQKLRTPCAGMKGARHAKGKGRKSPFSRPLRSV